MFRWLPFLTYAFAALATPGPNTILSFSTASRVGFRRSLPFCAGVWVGFFCVMLLCTAFCSLLQSYLPMLHLPMLIVGALYLIYLAWHTYKSTDAVSAAGEAGSFRKGLVLQFANIKVYLCCLMRLRDTSCLLTKGRLCRLPGSLH